MTSHGPSERAFGLTFTVVSLAGAGIAWWRGHTAAGIALAAIAVLFAVAALTRPRLLKGPNRLWRGGAHTLAWVQTRILLTLFFLLVMVPVGVVMRSFGRNPLRPARPDTNWHPASRRRADPDHYDRQF